MQNEWWSPLNLAHPLERVSKPFDECEDNAVNVTKTQNRENVRHPAEPWPKQSKCAVHRTVRLNYKISDTVFGRAVFVFLYVLLTHCGIELAVQILERPRKTIGHLHSRCVCDKLELITQRCTSTSIGHWHFCFLLTFSRCPQFIRFPFSSVHPFMWFVVPSKTFKWHGKRYKLKSCKRSLKSARAHSR